MNPDDTNDAARWEKVQAIFHEVADLPESERDDFLKTRCAGDAALFAEVTALLEEDARGVNLLERGVADVADRVFGSNAIPGDLFGPYRLASVLGEGGMGIVYLGERSDLGSVAAIKILRDAWLSPARRDRFASEQRTLAQLNHPSIARLYDADTLPNGTPWFAMEFVEGEPLTDWCAARGSSIRERLQLFRAVCEAVQHAHRHAVIHRDLKPSNILVTKDGAVKLLDFGISKQLESLDVAADQTRTGLKLMTPAYAAPEQVRGDRVGVHTDVYSLGVVFYELLTGRLPFDLSRSTPGEIEAAILERTPEKPSVAAKALSAKTGASWVRSEGKAAWADLDVLCLTAMQKEPERRYRTVEALVRDVDHQLRGEPLEARPDSVRYKTGKFLRRHWRPVTAASIAFAVLAGLVVFYTIRLASARNDALAEATRTQRIQRFTMDLFSGGDAETGPAESLRVVTLVERGVLEARSLEQEPAVQAELYGTLGTISQELGNLARADTLLAASLEKRRALFGTGSAEVVESLVALGLLRLDQAEYEESEKFVREALDTGTRRLPAGHPALAGAKLALGRVLVERGEYDDATRMGEDAVRLYTTRDGKVTPELTASLNQLAAAHFYAGRYETADSLNLLVLPMQRRLYGDRHPRIAEVLINLGASKFDRGSYAEAERYDREGLEIIEAYYGADHPETAYAMTMLGRALVLEEKFDEGLTFLHRALAIRERVFGKSHPQVASTLNEIGSVALQRGELDDAKACYTRVIDIYRKAYGEKHYLIGIALSNLASVVGRGGDYATAEGIFRDVLRVYEGELAPDHMNVGITRIKLGRSILRQGRYAAAAAETRAGYDILINQADPGVSFLRAAREDLAAAYDSLGRKEDAARFRAELEEEKKRAEADEQK